MPERQPVGKTGEAKKLTTSFQWLDRDTWPALERLATSRGFTSVGLFARHLCEQAIREPAATPVAGPMTAPAPSEGNGQLAALAASLEAVRGDVARLVEAQPVGDVRKLRRAVRDLGEVVKDEFVQLREDAGKRIELASGELNRMRYAIALAAVAVLTEVKPDWSGDTVNQWVAERFFDGFPDRG
ncbi:MAG: hypothetical protein K2X82_02100 [Gemmataceae bacterium]|nr:hypothetical protein [Gemmataceae bacterium]